MKIDTFTDEEIRLAEGIYLLLMKKNSTCWEYLVDVIQVKYCEIAKMILSKIREDESEEKPVLPQKILKIRYKRATSGELLDKQNEIIDVINDMRKE